MTVTTPRGNDNAVTSVSINSTTGELTYVLGDTFMNHPMFCASAVGDITEITPPDTVDVLKNKDRYIESKGLLLYILSWH